MSRISAFQRAQRAFRNARRFHFVASGHVPDELRQLVMESGSGGSTIGVYVNPPGIEPRAVMVAEQGLLPVGTTPLPWIRFAEIEGVRGPNPESSDSDIVMTMKSGAVATLSIAGQDGRFRDVFLFLRFLDRVVADRARG